MDDLQLYVERFFRKYVRAEADVITKLAAYAISTWKPLDEVKYLQLVGGVGTGKTWIGTLMFFVCQKAVRAEVYTPSVLLRELNDSGPCTLILDMEDTGIMMTDPNLIELILVNGTMRGRRIGRMDQAFDWKFYDVFGPKVILSKKQFSEPAIQSRCISIRLKAPTELLPTYLKDEMVDEAMEVRETLFRVLGVRHE